MASISPSPSSSTTLASSHRTSHSFLCSKPIILHPRNTSASILLQTLNQSLRFQISLRGFKRRRRTSAIPVIRASVQLPTGIRPGSGGIETDKLPSDIRDRAMEAVDYYGGRVTIGDVASKAGLKLNEAERALQAIAADTGGFLEVMMFL